MEQNKVVQTRLVHLLQEGSIALPVVLFKEYKRLGLSEKEVMLLIHLYLYQEKEHKTFPTINELEERMNVTADELIQLIERLVRSGLLEIEEEVNESGLHSERYCLTPLFERLAISYMERQNETEEKQENSYENIFHLFEQEFGRPLSPWECETLAQWIDVDGYKEELIEAALREAIFCGKMSIRYIDRILLEWQQNQIETVEQAIEYSRKFRQRGMLYQSTEKSQRAKPAFSFYNWVNQE
ncbi:DnaD domain-containing protein [Thermoflavimicrobium dichotomicum]|uniref:DNA replication protein n=1 Tax=Thermoflavimicrobium dichotomicum TaxID=46223 RepID=A0A1I3RZW9_9BACL|nr:DnaD domain-containing protein [Thermoflavimicrobium dichotomicum]SFJ50816.1 DNA replication protein [Thermoflavimicrobium dichotomicum]